MTGPTRPILRYHGGKWELGPWIISHFPTHRIYVEPYGGGGSVLLRKPRCYSEIYNDLDGEVVNLFRVARERGEELRRALELTPFSRDEFFAAYEPTDEPLERARRMVTRAYQGFGSNSHEKISGFRANAHRSGTTPAHDWRNYPGKFGAIVDRLRGVVIENRPALQVMAHQDREDALHYVDPPYVHSTRGHGGDYPHEMNDQQHRELAEFLHTLKGAVIVSGYHSALYDELFGGWERVEREAQADGARPRIEVLWLRNVDRGMFPGF